MITKNITKLFIAIVLTIAVTVGSSVVEEQTGFAYSSSAYACSGGSGGGC